MSPALAGPLQLPAQANCACAVLIFGRLASVGVSPRQFFRSISGGKGGSRIETVAACKASVTASEDPQKESGCKKEVFAAKVLEVYERIFCTDVDRREVLKRPCDALGQRFRRARCEYLKFDGIKVSIKAQNPTWSLTDEDIERAGLAFYNGEATLSQMYTFLRSRTAGARAESSFKDALYYLQTTNVWAFFTASQSERPPIAAPVVEQEEESSEQIEAQEENALNESMKVSAQSSTDDLSSIPSLPVQVIYSGRKMDPPTGRKRASDIVRTMAALNRGADAMDKKWRMRVASVRRSQRRC